MKIFSQGNLVEHNGNLMVEAFGFHQKWPISPSNFLPSIERGEEIHALRESTNGVGSRYTYRIEEGQRSFLCLNKSQALASSLRELKRDLCDWASFLAHGMEIPSIEITLNIDRILASWPSDEGWFFPSRQEFDYIKEDGLFKHKTVNLQVQGVGPSRILNGGRTASTRKAVRGTNYHKQVETGKAEASAPMLMLQHLKDFYEVLSQEALVSGKWEGLNIVAWADAIAICKRTGQLCVLDYKFSTRPVKFAAKWKAQVVLESILIREQIGILPEPRILVINPEVENPEVVSIVAELSEFPDLLAILRRGRETNIDPSPSPSPS